MVNLTYPKIALGVLGAGATFALFWCIYLFFVELFGGDFASMPTMLDALQFKLDDKIIWSFSIPSWLAGMPRIAADPLAAMVFATIVLCTGKLLSPNLDKKGDVPSIIFGALVGIILGFISISASFDFGIVLALIAGGILSVILGFIIGTTEGIFGGSIAGVSSIASNALMLGIYFGMPIGVLALLVMAVPYFIFGVSYLLYRGGREIVVARAKQDSSSIPA